MIRPISLSDIDEVMDIWLKSNIKTHNFVAEKYWQDNYSTVKNEITQAEVYVYINDEDNNILAFVGLVDDYIAGIFVKENARSKGIGKKLLDYVKVLNSKLTLEVYAKNKRAIHFYEREKFVIQSQEIDKDTNEKEFTMIWVNSNKNDI